MGAPCSRPYYPSTSPIYLSSPADTLTLCYGTPGYCCCSSSHGHPRYLLSVPSGGGRRRYVDATVLLDRSGGMVQQQNFGGVHQNFFGGAQDAGEAGFGGLGWKDPKEWTTRDYKALSDMLEIYARRQRARRRRYDGYGDDGDDDGGGGSRKGGVDYRDLMTLVARVRDVEDTVYGSERERRDAAFRARLARVVGGGGGDRAIDYGDDRFDDGLGDAYRGAGGGREGARFAQQQRERERREREQRNIDRETEEMRGHIERLKFGRGSWREAGDERPYD